MNRQVHIENGVMRECATDGSRIESVSATKTESVPVKCEAVTTKPWLTVLPDGSWWLNEGILS